MEGGGARERVELEVGPATDEGLLAGGPAVVAQQQHGALPAVDEGRRAPRGPVGGPLGRLVGGEAERLLERRLEADGRRAVGVVEGAEHGPAGEERTLGLLEQLDGHVARLALGQAAALLGRIDVLQPQLQVAQPRARLRPLDAAVVPPHHARHLVVRAQPLRAAAGRPVRALCPAAAAAARRRPRGRGGARTAARRGRRRRRRAADRRGGRAETARLESAASGADSYGDRHRRDGGDRRHRIG
mmetsp:Transcript_45422/g.125971  ORF Transcript_45422/g.125971 Transcript_45422/m.125971 type:complete len:244 (+) Transcript_45422:783-1514(+)